MHGDDNQRSLNFSSFTDNPWFQAIFISVVIFQNDRRDLTNNISAFQGINLMHMYFVYAYFGVKGLTHMRLISPAILTFWVYWSKQVTLNLVISVNFARAHVTHYKCLSDCYHWVGCLLTINYRKKSGYYSIQVFRKTRMKAESN